MAIALKIGDIKIYWYGIIFAIAVFLAYFLILKLSKISKLPQKHLESSLYIVLIFGLLGARAYHVADFWDYYSLNLLDTVKIWQGGIGIYGGLLGGLAGLLFYTYIRKLNTLSFLDVITPGVILAQSVGRLGNYFNQEAYGYPTTLPWAVKIDQSNRLPGYEAFSTFHPTFFYESILSFLAAAVLIWFFRKFHKQAGLTFGLYLVFYGSIRFFTEKFRIDTWQTGEVKVAELISIIIVALGLITFIAVKKRNQVDKT